MGKRWLPLESNPVVLNDFTSKLGLDVSQYSFHDVFGLDEVSPCEHRQTVDDAYFFVRSSPVQDECCHRTSWPLSHSRFWRCFCSIPLQRTQRQRKEQVDLPVCTRHTCERQHPRPVGQHQQAAWYGAAEDERLRSEGYSAPSSVYYMKQTIGNACGTIGALHAIANNEQALPLGAPLTTIQAT